MDTHLQGLSSEVAEEVNQRLNLDALGNLQVVISPSPMVVNPEAYNQMCELHENLIRATVSSLERWWTDPTILRVPPRIERLLLSRECPKQSPIGCYRPDLLLGQDNSMRICEINARFTLNGYLLSARLAQAVRGGAFGPLSDFFPSPLTLRFAEDLKSRFLEGHVVHCISGREPKHDLAWLSNVVEAVYIMPHQLRVSEEGVLVSTSEGGEDVVVRQCVLELHQDEIESLRDPVLECLMDLSVAGRCLNPLWTIYLIHDKRCLKVLREALPDDVMHKHIVPTSVDVSVDALKPMWEVSGGDLVIKPALFGKGEGIVIGSGDALVDRVRAMKVPCVVQPYVSQRLYDVATASGVRQWKVVGTLLCMDNTFYGPGIFRSNDAPLVALTTGGVAIVPVVPSVTPIRGTTWTLPDATPTTPGLADSLAKEIKQGLRDHGLAVLSLPHQAITPSTLEEILNSLGTNFRDHKNDGSFCWVVSPTGGNSKARSHTCEDFETHTDASYEEDPPRYFALAVERQDRTGNGRTSFAKFVDAVDRLSERHVDILRTTNVGWKRPPEFAHEGAKEMIFGPVLFSRKCGRMRRDIIDTSHLDKEIAAEFWEAFNLLYDMLTEECKRNSSVLPEGCILLVDNWRYVHSRTTIKDQTRKLWRIRFDLKHERTPICNKAELLSRLDERLLKGRGLYWSPSGGTTSNGSAECSCLPCTYSENEAMRLLLRDEFRARGILDGGVAINLMTAGHLYRSMEVFQHAFVKGGVTEIPLGVEASDDSIVSACQRFGVTTICAYPSRLVQLAAYLHENGLVIPLVKTLVFGGEKFTQRHREFVASAMNAGGGTGRVRFHGVYGSSETGVFACTDGRDEEVDVYHYSCDGVLVEILQLDGLDEECEAGETGRIVATNLLRKEFPIVRYDTQDVGRRVGRHSFTVDGRHEAAARYPLGMFNLDFNEICAACLGPIQDTSSLCVAQIWITTRDNYDVVRLCVYSADPCEQSVVDEVRSRLASFLSPALTEVEVVPHMHLLHRATRSAKLLPFVDKRT